MNQYNLMTPSERRWNILIYGFFKPEPTFWLSSVAEVKQLFHQCYFDCNCVTVTFYNVSQSIVKLCSVYAKPWISRARKNQTLLVPWSSRHFNRSWVFSDTRALGAEEIIQTLNPKSTFEDQSLPQLSWFLLSQQKPIDELLFHSCSTFWYFDCGFCS